MIASLEIDPEIEEGRVAEVERRHAAIESSVLSLISGPEAFAKLKAERTSVKYRLRLDAEEVLRDAAALYRARGGVAVSHGVHKTSTESALCRMESSQLLAQLLDGLRRQLTRAAAA